ncbi:MAG: hypothetical protein JWP97_2075 [Labilithrix sp.]|nr:hypothetical protein [Labilithrix sp.]
MSHAWIWLRRARLWLVAALTYAYFVSGSDPNQATRFALTEAIVTRHAPDITPVHYRTLDKGYVGGKFYADKAPGISLLAVPAFAVLRVADRAFGIDPSSLDAQRSKLYFLTLLLAGVPGVAAALLLRRLARRLGCGAAAAELAAFAYAFGTLAFPFSTVLFGHQLAAFLLLGMTTLAVEARARGALASTRTLLALGALGGTAVVVEYPTAFFLAVFGVSLLLACGERGRMARSMGRVVLLTAIGALPLLALHAGFLWWCYGRLALPYTFVSEPFFRAHMSSGIFGIGMPNRTATLGSLVSPYRGLLFYCPVVTLYAAGLGAWIATGRNLRLLAVAVPGVLVHLLFAFSYYAWDGGRSLGPRHLVPVLPFLVLPIAFLADRSRAAYVLTVLLTVASSVMMLACTFVLIHLPEGDPFTLNPFYDVVVPAVQRGEGALNAQDAFVPYARADAAFNWGMLVGLGGHGSLLVVPLVWLIAYAPEVIRLRPVPAGQAARV